MRTMMLIGAVLMMSVAVLAQEATEDTTVTKYIGAEGCKKCHKTVKQGNQFKVWSESKHSQAYETLKGAKAAEIARQKGLKTAAYEAPECLKCHITEFDVAPEMLSIKYTPQMGVQCESCHGAGSLYKKKKIMKDREEALKNGLKPILVKDGSAEELCKTCHNSESPTFKEFNFQERWEKIAHPVPEK